MASLEEVTLLKLLTLVSVACLSAVVASQAIGYKKTDCILRDSYDSDPGRVVLTASSLQRHVSESGVTILHLSGNVEVRVITCRPGQDRSDACDVGSVVLHADAVDYNEKTGEIRPTGNVHVEPYPTGSSKSLK